MTIIVAALTLLAAIAAHHLHVRHRFTQNRRRLQHLADEHEASRQLGYFFPAPPNGRAHDPVD